MAEPFLNFDDCQANGIKYTGHKLYDFLVRHYMIFWSEIIYDLLVKHYMIYSSDNICFVGQILYD